MRGFGNTDGKSVLRSCQFLSPSNKKIKRFKPIRFSSGSKRWEGNSSFVPTKLEFFAYLPEDLITQILLRLPVKSLLRFKCVSKSWCALVKDPTFVKNHLLKHDGTRKMLLLGRCLPPPKSDQDVLSFHDLGSPNREVRSSLPLSFIKRVVGHQYPDYVFSFSGAVKGIICMMVNRTSYILCNPALGQFRTLPLVLFDSPDLDYFPDIQADGFGVSSYPSSFTTSHDLEFKIIVMHRFVHKHLTTPPLPLVYAHLYNSRTSSWRRLDDAPVMPVMRFPGNVIFFNGACHWSGALFSHPNCRTILSFDMASEVFRLLELPDCLSQFDGGYPHPVVLNNCLGVVQCKEWSSSSVPIEIWVMQKYGVKESWTKQFVASPLPFVTTFLPGKNDTMLLLKQPRMIRRRAHGTRHVDDRKMKDQLTSINLRTSKMKKFQVFGAETTLRGLIYEESLSGVRRIPRIKQYQRALSLVLTSGLIFFSWGSGSGEAGVETGRERSCADQAGSSKVNMGQPREQIGWICSFVNKGRTLCLSSFE